MTTSCSQTVGSTRSQESLRRHYEIERELADRLRYAAPADRPQLYCAVYDELFRRVPDHSQLTRKKDAAAQQEATDRQLRFLNRFLKPDTVYLEVGPGDCHLAATIARQVRHVYAVDVSDEIIGKGEWPANFSAVIFDGVHIDIPAGAVNVAYSHQVLEHLHPDDAQLQLQRIHDALAPGGVYLCTTPHRFSGPHDISKLFDTEATGFHLKEYTCRELRDLFLQSGFAATRVWGALKGRVFALPNPLVSTLETALSFSPRKLRRWLGKMPPLRAVFDSVTIAGYKAPTRSGSHP